ncbi:MAG: DUF5063 domain-containing protein [Bacteroidales bacterium]|nr:DUF5063 domain-containing protein [Bacteroidales bacterium]MBN2699514.1 DUF5063 domain-containing protein [Bacteroidales bacterium]
MQEENLNLHYVYAPEVLEFVRSCNAFCSYLETLSETQAQDFIPDMIGLLSGIYASAVKIDQPEPIYDGNEKVVTEEDWSLVYRTAAKVLGPYNAYLRIVDEEDYDRSDLITHNISEDLSDIYQELRDFTGLYSRGLEDIMNDALWEVRGNFEEHWGEKLLNALAALHRLYVKKVDLEWSNNHISGEVGQKPPDFDNSLFERYRDQSGKEDE